MPLPAKSVRDMRTAVIQQMLNGVWVPVASILTRTQSRQLHMTPDEYYRWHLNLLRSTEPNESWRVVETLMAIRETEYE